MRKYLINKGLLSVKTGRTSVPAGWTLKRGLHNVHSTFHTADREGQKWARRTKQYPEAPTGGDRS